jgi:hypothetical protein
MPLGHGWIGSCADFLTDEGADVRVDSKGIGVEKLGNSIGVKVESAGKISQVVGTHVLGCAFVEGTGMRMA